MRVSIFFFLAAEEEPLFFFSVVGLVVLSPSFALEALGDLLGVPSEVLDFFDADPGTLSHHINNKVDYY